MKKEIVEIINKLVDTAIKKYGKEDKNTIAIAKNAENLKQKYLENNVKLF